MDIKKRISEITNITNYDSIVGDETIDVQHMLARTKQNILWTNYRLDTEDDKLKELFDNINENNNLLQIFKGMEKYLSIQGKAYLVFDIFKKGEYGYKEKTVKIMMGLPTSNRNQTLREFQQIEYAGVVELQTTSSNNGLVQTVLQCRTLSETQNIPLNSAVPHQLPIDVFKITAPDFLNPYREVHTRKHNYGVLSMKEMLNRNTVDFNGMNDYTLPDDYPVSYLRNMINSFLVFIKKEQSKNSTRWAGSFSSYADMFKSNPDTAEYLYTLKNPGLTKQNKMDYINQGLKRKSILEDDYILYTRGQNITIDKLQSTFSMQDMSNGLISLLEIYFNGAGFDYAVQTMSGASQYTSTSEIQTQNRRTTETIKEAIVLRQEQIRDFFNHIIDAWFGKVGSWKKYKDKWDFKVISNIVNEEAYSIEKIVLMKENQLISKELAIEKANKDLSESDLQKLIETIEKEEKEQEAKDKEMMKMSGGLGEENGD